MRLVKLPSPTFAPSLFCNSCNLAHIATVPERDANKEALRQVEKATDSKPVEGEELLASEKLKRQLREAKRHVSDGPKSAE